MKYLLLMLLILVRLSNLEAQSQQTKTFYVNACRFYGSFQTELEPLCDGFNVKITTKTIDLAANGTLTIKSHQQIEGGRVQYLVIDPKNEIKAVIHGFSSRGNDFIQVVFANNSDKEKESGIIFQFWDHVSSYNFWRTDRAQRKSQ